MAGLTAAHRLIAAGHTVKLFDKGRGVGGRIATRRSPTGRQFDHGAQYFTAKTPEFQAAVDDWVAAGVVAEWNARVVTLTRGKLATDPSDRTRYVGTPAMNRIAKHLAEGLDVSTGVRATSVERVAGRWKLLADDVALGEFDGLVVTAPPIQARELLGELAIADECLTNMSGCWTVMIEFAAPIPVDFDAAFVNDSPLAWIARNNSKPGRDANECWVLHASPAWSEANIDNEPDEVTPPLLAAFATATGASLPASIHQSGHRWRYALPEKPLAQRAIVDVERCVAVAGDWCGGPRVEGAYLSGIAAAERLLPRSD